MVSERLNSRARVWSCEVEIESSDPGLYFRLDLTVVQGGKQGRCRVHFVPKQCQNHAEWCEE